MKPHLLTLLFFVTAFYGRTQVLDQLNASTYNSGWVVNYDAYTAVGQSFTAGYTGELAKVVISIDTPSVSYPVISGTFELRIYAGAGYAGTLLGSETFFVPTGLPYGDFEIGLTNSVNITNGNQYTFAVEEISGTGQIQLNATANNYPGGNLYNTILTSTTSFPTYDLLFKTYVNVNTYATLDVSKCDEYTSPSGNYTWTTSGTYLDTIPNTMGGDSVITVNLTINTVDVSVTNTYPSLTANATGATYQWLDCKNGMAPIAGETAQSFTPTGGGQFAVLVTQSGCSDTSVCETISAVGYAEKDLQGMIAVYPNPTTGKLSIDFGTTSISCLRLVSLTGQLIWETVADLSGIYTLEMNEPAGIYWIEYVDQDNNKGFVRLLKL